MNDQREEVEQTDKPETKSAADEQQSMGDQPVVWGEEKRVGENEPIEYSLGETTFEIVGVGEGVVQVKEVGSSDPHFLASSGQESGIVRMGHIRWEQPNMIRFPQPIKVLPGATFETYSTYPTRPGIYWEVDGKEPVKLVELPGIPLKKTHYGPLTGGTVCNLHDGPHKKEPALLEDDPRVLVVNISIRNTSDEPHEVGILLLEPPLLSFYVRDNQLCLNSVEFIVSSETEGHVNHLDRPSLEGAELVEGPLHERDDGLSLNLLRSIIEKGSMNHGY